MLKTQFVIKNQVDLPQEMGYLAASLIQCDTKRNE